MWQQTGLLVKEVIHSAMEIKQGLVYYGKEV